MNDNRTDTDMEPYDMTPQNQEDTEEIDLMAMFTKAWNKRKWILKMCGVGLLVGVVVALSTPKEYTVTTTLAPETTGTSSSSSGLGALASMAGINLGSSVTGTDAIGPTFYSDIVASTPFLVDLFSIRVKDDEAGIDETLYEYMRDDQSRPWWSYLSPGKLIGSVMSLFSSKEEPSESSIDPQRLTRKQAGVATAISDKITVENDKTMISISVSMQSAEISAQVADSVTSKIQQYVTDYRTNKARKDLEYTEKMYAEAEEDYRAKQSEYARFVDANQNIIMQSFLTEQERLQNERDLAYNVYNTVAQQLQAAKMRVQETKPVFAVIQTATVPLVPSKPRKTLIVVAFIFLAFVGSAGWVVYGKDVYEDLRRHLKSEEENGKSAVA